jgi:hypothetical protein
LLGALAASGKCQLDFDRAGGWKNAIQNPQGLKPLKKQSNPLWATRRRGRTRSARPFVQ